MTDNQPRCPYPRRMGRLNLCSMYDLPPPETHPLFTEEGRAIAKEILLPRIDEWFKKSSPLWREITRQQS